MLENYPNLLNYFKLTGFIVVYVNGSILTNKLIIDLDTSINSGELFSLINDFGLIKIRSIDKSCLRLVFDINQIN